MSKYEVYDADLMYGFDPDFDGDGTVNSEKSDASPSNMSPDEALVTCLNERGAVEMKRLKELTSLTVEQLACALQGAIFQDPEALARLGRWRSDIGWVLREQYLSGNLHDKLATAEEMNERYRGRFEENVRVLKELLPTSQGIEDIHVSLGAPWIPASIHTMFIKRLLRLKGEVKAIFNRELLTWKISIAESAQNEVRNSVLNTLNYGTADMSAIKIIERTMNDKAVKVYREEATFGWNTERVPDREATLEACEKQKLIIAEFENFVRSDMTVKATLEDCYNAEFVGYSHSPYNGDFLKLPDLNPEVKLYKYQLDAVARILLSPNNVFLAHDVGTGKTFEIVVGLHELYRMGKSRKNLAVVPNNVLQATVDVHRRLYPDDKILVVYPKDFVPKNRDNILRKIRDDEQVAVYMAYSSFNMIVMSKQYWIDKMHNEIKDLKAALLNCSRKEEKHMLEVAVKRLEKKLSKYVSETAECLWMTQYLWWIDI